MALIEIILFNQIKSITNSSLFADVKQKIKHLSFHIINYIYALLKILIVLEFSLITGLLASILHVLTGPDHLSAVLTFVIESKRKACKIVLFCGIGHLAVMILIGVLFILFKSLIHFEKISEYIEQLVGLVLIGIGLWSLIRIFKKNDSHEHLHVHSENNPVIHSHEHFHKHEKTHHHQHKKSEKQSYLASLSIGVLHGLAGIAHFLIFLPVIGFESQLDSTLYILGFAIGTVLSMTIFAFTIGKLSSFSKTNHNDAFFNGIRLAAGLIALIIGFYWFFSN